MEIIVSLKVEDYVYKFYKKGAEALNRSPEERMEEAIFIYAGLAAQDMMQKTDKTADSNLDSSST